MVVGRALIIVLLFAMLSGCGSQWLPSRIRVDAAVVHEVRSVGKSVGQTTSELEYEGAVQVVDILVLDLSAASFSEALELAHDNLRRHGWIDMGREPKEIYMRSKKWDGVDLAIGSLGILDSYGVRQSPELANLLKVDTSESQSYLVAELSRRQ